MGLDQYLYAISMEDWNEQRFTNAEELGHWRKHPNLHGWFQNLWRQRNGTTRPLRHEKVVVRLPGLAGLASAVIKNELPYCEGEYFGTSEDSDSQLSADLEIIQDAVIAARQGKVVYYEASA